MLAVRDPEVVVAAHEILATPVHDAGVARVAQRHLDRLHLLAPRVEDGVADAHPEALDAQLGLGHEAEQLAQRRRVSGQRNDRGSAIGG